MARLRWLPWAALTWIIGAALLLITSVPVSQAAMLSAVVVVQVLAGMVIWRAVTLHLDRDRDLVELVGMGVALGMGGAVVSGAVVGLVLPGWPGWLIPALGAGVVWFWPASRLHESPSWTVRRSSAIPMAVGLVVGLGGIWINLSNYPLTWAGQWSGYHRDMLFFEGLSTSIARYGPLDSIFMSGAEIRYHWLAYGWTGQLAETVGAAPFVALTRVLPLVALVMVMALAASWAARLAGNWRVGVLAVLLIGAGGYLGAVNGTILNFDSPSESVSSAWLLALLIAVFTALHAPRPMLVVSVGALAFLAAGGKISAGAMGLAATGLVVVVRTLRRTGRGTSDWLVLGAACAGVAAAFLLLISGTATDGTLQVLSVDARAAFVQGLLLDKSPIGIAAGTLALIIAICARWAGMWWLVGSRTTRWRDETVAGIALVVASLIPVLVLSEGVSETWFALAASAPLSVLSAWGIGEAWRRIQSRMARVLSALAVIPIVAFVTFLWAQGVDSAASARFWGPVLGTAAAVVTGLLIAAVTRADVGWLRVWAGSSLTILVLSAAVARVTPIAAPMFPTITYLTGPVGNVGTAHFLPDGSSSGPIDPTVLAQADLPPDRTAWSGAFAAAGETLFEYTSDADIVVTNDVTSFLVPALSQRLTYLSGAPYQWQYGSAATVDGIPERARVSQAFVNDADRDAFAALCQAGVTWLWASHDLTDRRDWQPYATVEFSNDEVSLARVDRTSCP